MKRFIPRTFADGFNPVFVALLVLAGLAAPSHAAFVTTDTYDENATQTNAVDTEAATNDTTLAAFTTAVDTAFDNDLGGVIDFDDGSLDTSTTFSATYGTSGTKSLAFTSSDSLELNANGDTSPQFTSISNTTALLTNSSGGGDEDFTLTITGGLVEQIAVTVLSRTTFSSSGDSIEVTATFSDSTTKTISSVVDNSKGGDDTFFSFLAPSGTSISSLRIHNTTTSGIAGRPIIDDLAFITVIPTPAALPAGLGLLALTALRRRRA